MRRTSLLPLPLLTLLGAFVALARCLIRSSY